MGGRLVAYARVGHHGWSQELIDGVPEGNRVGAAVNADLVAEDTALARQGA